MLLLRWGSGRTEVVILVGMVVLTMLLVLEDVVHSRPTHVQSESDGTASVPDLFRAQIRAARFDAVNETAISNAEGSVSDPRAHRALSQNNNPSEKDIPALLNEAGNHIQKSSVRSNILTKLESNTILQAIRERLMGRINETLRNESLKAPRFGEQWDFLSGLRRMLGENHGVVTASVDADAFDMVPLNKSTEMRALEGAQPPSEAHRYLLYNPSHGQLFQQYKSLVNFLNLGRSLRCCILVIPPILPIDEESTMSDDTSPKELQNSVRREADNPKALQQGIYEQWETYFDVRNLSNLTGTKVISWDQFKSLPVFANRKNVSTLLVTTAYEQENNRRDRTTKFWEDLGFLASKSFGTGRDICDLGVKRNPSEDLKKEILSQPSESLILLGVTYRHCEDNDRQGNFDSIQQALLPIAPIRDLITKAVKDDGFPSYCLHLRMTEGDCRRSSRSIGVFILKYLDAHVQDGKSSRIYFAYHPRFRAVRDAVRLVRSEYANSLGFMDMNSTIDLAPDSVQKIVRSPIGRAVTDAWACSHATHLITHAGSATSRRIEFWQGFHTSSKATSRHYNYPVLPRNQWSTTAKAC
uniref:O-fucosyltransferase family protein n=2 Tax=Compsopogon caeruleus TaxID=31354 RepID=A0A7S1XH56_9RHOD|mmetsp:Transcript_7976/g.16023  ORF Transcript_7976/g.16023 Transcript_7976/m.16023 type:complete len:584 (+) Transcript_7976:319-2070(+)